MAAALPGEFAVVCSYNIVLGMADSSKPSRYLSFTFEHAGGRPGFMHIQRCLVTLIEVAQLSGRTALLPPPSLLLHPDHNYGAQHGPAELDGGVAWTRYFNLSTLIAAGAVALSPAPSARFWSPPTKDSRAWSLNRAAARVAGSEHLPPQTPWWELARMPQASITLDFADGWAANRYVTDCAHESVGARHESSHPWPPSFRPFSAPELPPSDAVLATSARLVAPLAKPFVMLHVRRGDALEGSTRLGAADTTRDANYSHGGCGVSNLRRATSPQHVAAAWRRFYPEHAPRAPLLVMTNELEPRYFKRLRALVPTVILARDMPEIRRMQSDMRDNYLAFQTLRFAAKHAAARIATSGCYLAGGCEHQLVEACTTRRRRGRRR